MPLEMTVDFCAGAVSSAAHTALARVRGKGIKLWSENGRLRYQAPRGALTQGDLELLRQHQRDLVTLIDEERRTTALGLVETPLEPIEEAPLSFSQRAHWQLHDLGRRRVFRQLVATIRLRGQLNIDALQRSFTALARRHDALRTVIVTRDGQPLQRVLASKECVIRLEDLSGVREVQRESALKQLLECRIGETVDVSEDPLLAVWLIQLSTHNQVLLIAMEHLIADASSLSILLEELFTAYNQFLSGRALSLPMLKIGFSQYSAWQHAAYSTWRQHHIEYWRNRLSGCARVRFPIETADSSGVGWGRLPVLIGADLKVQLAKWCQIRRTTLPIAVLTAYVALVLRWCNVTDSVFQYQTDGRDLPELQSAIGYFAAILFLRIEQHPDDDFDSLLTRVTEEYCRARDHADFSSIAAQVPRPEFARNTGFNWVPHTHPEQQVLLSDSPDALAWSEMSLQHPMLEQLDLDHEPMIVLRDKATEIGGELYFPRNRFSIEIMTRLRDSFLSVISTLLTDPKARVRDLMLFS